MKQIGKDRWAVGDWVAIAFDGSRDATPRTKSNQRAYCAADYGNGKTARSKKTRNGKAKQRASTGKHGASSAAGFARLDHTDVARGPSTSVDVASGAIEHE